uniref:Protein lingerer n=1 Tax=Anopheles merus TaxID=30066 RepID=A0A182UY72_ANOME
MSTQTRSGGGGGGGGRNKSKAKHHENKENLAKEDGQNQSQQYPKGGSGPNNASGNDGSAVTTGSVGGGRGGDHQKQKGSGGHKGTDNAAPKVVDVKEKQQREAGGGSGGGAAGGNNEKSGGSTGAASGAGAGGASATHTVVKAKQPTAEQIRIAQITDIKSGMDDPKIQEKIQSLMETTQRSEEEVCCALQECDSDLDRAVIFLLETLPVGAFATTSKKKKSKSQAAAQKDGEDGGDWETTGPTTVGGASVQLGGINVDLKEQQRRGGNRGGSGNQRSGGPGRGGRAGGYRDGGGDRDRDRDRNGYDKGGEGGGYRNRAGGDGGRMRGGRDGPGGPGRGNYGSRGGRGGGPRLGTRGPGSRDQNRGSRMMNNDHQEIDSWDPVTTPANANDLKPEDCTAFTDTWGDWDNEEYTGTLADTKGYAGAVASTTAPSAGAGAQQQQSQQSTQTGVPPAASNVTELAAPPGLEQQVLNPPPPKDTELVQQYSTTVVSSTATAAVAAGGATGVASVVPQYSDLHAGTPNATTAAQHLRQALDMPPMNTSSSLSAEQTSSQIMPGQGTTEALSSQNDALANSYSRTNASGSVSTSVSAGVNSMSNAAAALDQLTKSDPYGQSASTNTALTGGYQNAPYSSTQANKTASYPPTGAPQGYNNMSYSNNQVTNAYPPSTNNYSSYNQGNVNAYQPPSSSVTNNVVPNNNTGNSVGGVSNQSNLPVNNNAVNSSSNNNAGGYLSSQYPVSQTSSAFPSQQNYQNSSQNVYGNTGLNSNTGVASSTVSNSSTNNSNNNVTSSSSLPISSVVSTTTKSSSTTSGTSVVTNLPMVNPYIQAPGLPFYQQAAVYSYEDLQLMQQRMPHVPGFYDINYQTPTSLGAAGVRDANLGSVAYSTMSDGRFTRTDNNSSPQQMPTNAATSGGQFQKPAYNTGGYGSATGYDTLGQSGQDYNKNAYQASIVGQQQSKGQTVANQQSGSGSGSDMAPSMYGKNHVAINKVNYDKQSFHSGTPPPYNIAGTQTAGTTSAQPYGQHLAYIPTMATHHNINMHQNMHQDSNSSGQRPQNNNQGKTASKQQGYSASTYWTGPN